MRDLRRIIDRFAVHLYFFVPLAFLLTVIFLSVSHSIITITPTPSAGLIYSTLVYTICYLLAAVVPIV